MSRFLSGAFVASLAAIALHIWGGDLLAWISTRGDHGPNCQCHREDIR